MGMFQVKVRVANPDEPGRSFEEKFWVDTSALYSFVPAKRLEGIGLVPLRSRELVMADGRHATMQLGEAPFTIEDLGEPLPVPSYSGLTILCISLALRRWRFSELTPIRRASL
jgi:hypothetical protein